VVVRLGVQTVEGDGDLGCRVAASGQPVGKQALLEVAVPVPVGPVAELVIAQLVTEQGEDTVLG